MGIGELILWTVVIIGSSGLWLGLPIAIINGITDPDGKKEDAKRKEQQKKWEDKRKTEQEQFETNNKPPEGNSWTEYRTIAAEKERKDKREGENKKYYSRGLEVITHVSIEDGKINGIYPSTAYEELGWSRAEIFRAIAGINENGMNIGELCSNLPRLELLSVNGADSDTLQALALSGKKIILRNSTINGEILNVLNELNLFPKLIGLCARGEGIEEIDLLSEAKDLQELDLQGNYISDLSPLEGLQKLRSINLSNNEIEYIGESLSGVGLLEELHLWGNEIEDYESIEPLMDKVMNMATSAKKFEENFSVDQGFWEWLNSQYPDEYEDDEYEQEYSTAGDTTSGAVLDDSLTFTLTFRDFLADIKNKGLRVKTGKPFIDGRPNSIAGYVGQRLKGMKSPLGRNSKELTHHKILKSAFGLNLDETRIVKKFNDISNKKDRFMKMCDQYPEIGNAPFQLKSLPKRWRKVYGN